LRDEGCTADALCADVTHEASVQALMDQAAALDGKLDILVNNAGTNIRKAAHEISLAEWNSVMDTNLTSAFLCSRAAHAHMKSGGGGKVINIGSMMSIFGAPYAPAYGASKGGIVQFTRSIATAWAADDGLEAAVRHGGIASTAPPSHPPVYPPRSALPSPRAARTTRETPARCPHACSRSTRHTARAQGS